MGIFNRFPSTEYNDLNLDWIIRTVGKLNHAFEETLQQITQYVEEHLGDIALSKFYRADDKTVILAEEYKATGTPSGNVENIQIDDNLYSIPINTLNAYYRPLYHRLILNDHVTTGTMTGDPLENVQIGDDIYTIPQLKSGEYKAALKNSKVFMMGNSWARGSGGVIGQGWPYYFLQATGATGMWIQQAGGDFTQGGNSDHSDYPGETYGSLMQNIVPTLLTADERAEYNYVIVGGGLNDASSSNASIRSAIASFITTTKSMFPNADIWIIPLPSTLEADVTLMNWMDAWTAGAQNNGAGTCVHTYGWFYNIPSLWHSQQKHLSDDGYKLCGAYIAALLCGWDGVKNVRNHVGWSGSNKCTFERVNYVRRDEISYLNLRFTISGSDLESGLVIGAIDPQYVPKDSIMINAIRWTSNKTTRAVDALEINPSGNLAYKTLGSDIDSSTTYRIWINSTWRIG